jgi:hypothetical protein
MTYRINDKNCSCRISFIKGQNAESKNEAEMIMREKVWREYSAWDEKLFHILHRTTRMRKRKKLLESYFCFCDELVISIFLWLMLRGGGAGDGLVDEGDDGALY